MALGNGGGASDERSVSTRARDCAYLKSGGRMRRGGDRSGLHAAGSRRQQPCRAGDFDFFIHKFHDHERRRGLPGGPGGSRDERDDRSHDNRCKHEHSSCDDDVDQFIDVDRVEPRQVRSGQVRSG